MDPLVSLQTQGHCTEFVVVSASAEALLLLGIAAATAVQSLSLSPHYPSVHYSNIIAHARFVHNLLAYLVLLIVIYF